MLQAIVRTIIFSFIIFFTNTLLAQPTNDNYACTGLPSLTPFSSCTTISGDLYQSTTSAITSTCGTTYDVWYSLTTPPGCNALNIDITPVTAGGNNLTSSNTFIQAFSEASCSLTPIGTCTALGTTLALTGLLPSTTYFVRVFVTTNPNSQSGKWDFDICATYTPPPTNDDCSNATTLTSSTSCSTTSGTMVNATASTGLPAGCESAGTHYDVWYKFVATSSTHTVTISGQGSNFTSSEMQLYSGTCGSLASIVCGTTSLTSSLLNVGTTYYIRVSSIGSSPSSNGGFSMCVTQPTAPVTVTSGRTNEVFQQTTLSGSGVLSYPWEVTYGPDDKLWITESRGYKVYRMDPNTGTKTTVLDLNSSSTDLSAWGADSLRAVSLTSTSNWNSSANAWPQGGLAGLAIHPQFLDGTGLHDYVYVSYVHRYLYTASGSAGIFFRNKIVRFTYNSGTGKLGSPAVVCDTVPGGQDHNSQRMIIAPVTKGGTNYLFYAAGDMGSGQFANRLRPQNAQNPDSYEGKILRFNLEPVAGSWIPSDNPYSSSSAVYSIGIRNNQGFAYDTLTNKLYGSSHGPYSDDEINVIESRRNYGHPLIEGFADGNYNGNSAQGTTTSISAGAPYTDNLGVSTCLPIGNEASNKAAIDASGNGLYKDPLFSAYAVPLGDLSTPGTVAYIWKNNPGNASPAPGWPTEAWSGLDLYSNKLIPGWKRSLIAASLKWGRLVRLKLNTNGDATAPNNSASDTVTYFNSQNRFRDLAFAPNGKDVFVIMDNSSTTSGPGSANPVVPGCAGCVQKYTFLGYLHNSSTNRSTIASSIDITSGTTNTLSNGTTITINAANNNNNLWVPITGPDGNIMAEIKANGNDLGTITSTFYNSGTAREDASKKLYLNRSLTITPQFQPASTVNVRLYITSAELAALMSATNSTGQGSMVTGIGDLKVIKNNDATAVALTASGTIITPTYAEAHTGTSTGGYVIQVDINSFSSFYFENPSMIALPLELVSFKGIMKNNDAYLNWESANENNASHFVVERSLDGQNFEAVGRVTATGNTVGSKYGFIDYDAEKQASPVIYYRLKMVDKDEAYTYSQIISLNTTLSNTPITVYPNPVNDILNFKLSLAGNDRLHIQITDMQGRTIYNKVKSVRAGTNEIKIDTRSWPAQSYSINVYDSRNKILFTQRLVKM